jgi:hypothetical protein
VGLPFTNDQFFGIFAEYNRAFLVVAIAFWLASIWALAFVSRDPAPRSRILSLFLGALWLWNAFAYHALLFTRINAAAWLFAALFGIQALLFFWAATRSAIEYFSSAGWKRVIGMGLTSYALAYPFVTMATGHTYPATPTFGVPCPTAILTIGLLVAARGRIRLTLAIIPLVWGFIGGSASLLLAVPTDYVLLGAGVLLTCVLMAQQLQPRGDLLP